MKNENPKISLCILSKDNPELISHCFDSFLKHNSYKNFEILVCETKMTERALTCYKKYHTKLNTDKEKPKFKCFSEDSYNFSKLSNYLANNSSGDYLLFLHDDVFITRDVLPKLLDSVNEKTGVIGAPLKYNNGKTDFGERAIEDGVGTYPIKRHKKCGKVDAVTSAFMFIKKSIFEAANQFEENYEDILQDVDLCLKVIQLGYENICISGEPLLHGNKTFSSSATRVIEHIDQDPERDYKRFKKNWVGNNIKNIQINVLTRTSNRPTGFKRCYDSIKKQTHLNINHIVSYDNDNDLSYLSKYEDITLVKIDRDEAIKNDKSPQNIESKLFWKSPHNLYCNYLLDEVDNGWVMFLDDDDEFKDPNALTKITSRIKDQDTMFFWQMEFLNGIRLPDAGSFANKTPKLFKIGSPCFLFHSKWKNRVRWDSFKCSDFRFVDQMNRVINKAEWIYEPFIQINSIGSGKRIDIK
jgi:GT2 family glycosyltransferase